MPEHLTREEAIDFAKGRSVERRLTYVLVWSRRDEIWCYADGSTHMEVAGPYTRLREHGNRGFVFG